MVYLLSGSNAKESRCNFLNNLNEDQRDIMIMKSPFRKATLFYIQKNESVVIEQ